MARTVPTNRLSSLIEAALRVFSLKGFRRAQMADIAREMGMSPGSLYNHVESKEALFYLVIDAGFGEHASRPASFPVRTPPPGAIAKRVEELFKTTAATPTLTAALKRPRAEDPSAELGAIVRELYAISYRTAAATRMVERSSFDLPQLADLFYRKIRGGLVSRLARLIESRADAGQFRRVPHPTVTARLLIETVTWFARNRHGDPASQDITDQAAEETVVDMLVNSLVVTGQSKNRRARRTSRVSRSKRPEERRLGSKDK
jgi:AcrR family transcriptional regulator